MRIATAQESPIGHGVPIYDIDGYALDFKMTSEACKLYRQARHASLALGTLQIELDAESGRLLYAWGFAPYTYWTISNSNNELLSVADCSLYASDADKFEPGVAYPVPGFECTRPAFDAKTGWLTFGDPSSRNEGKLLRFATDTVALLIEEQIKALFVRLSNLEEVLKVLPATAR